MTCMMPMQMQHTLSHILYKYFSIVIFDVMYMTSYVYMIWCHIYICIRMIYDAMYTYAYAWYMMPCTHMHTHMTAYITIQHHAYDIMYVIRCHIYADIMICVMYISFVRRIYHLYARIMIYVRYISRSYSITCVCIPHAWHDTVRCQHRCLSSVAYVCLTYM